MLVNSVGQFYIRMLRSILDQRDPITLDSLAEPVFYDFINKHKRTDLWINRLSGLHINLIIHGFLEMRAKLELRKCGPEGSVQTH